MSDPLANNASLDQKAVRFAQDVIEQAGWWKGQEERAAGFIVQLLSHVAEHRGLGYSASESYAKTIRTLGLESESLALVSRPERFFSYNADVPDALTRLGLLMDDGACSYRFEPKGARIIELARQDHSLHGPAQKILASGEIQPAEKSPGLLSKLFGRRATRDAASVDASMKNTHRTP